MLRQKQYIASYQTDVKLFCFAANGIIKDQRVADAMKAIDRGIYCRSNPYMDSPQGIGYAVTISAPHMVLCCLVF